LGVFKTLNGKDRKVRKGTRKAAVRLRVFAYSRYFDLPAVNRQFSLRPLRTLRLGVFKTLNGKDRKVRKGTPKQGWSRDAVFAVLFRSRTAPEC